jgi:aspartate dehydrogenase
MALLRVGIVGCGTIGTRLALTLEREETERVCITALNDISPSAALNLQQALRSRPPILSLAQLIRRSQFIVEAASSSVVPDLLRRALHANRGVLVMSSGGLLKDRSWVQHLADSRGKIYVPSGALAGLDGMKSMAVGPIKRMSLTTRKPPSALAGAPYCVSHNINLQGLLEPKEIFSGSPWQVVEAFPQNTNVAAALALAGGEAGAEAHIRVVADPHIHMNVHEVDVEGDCGRIRVMVENRPSANPKTSELAVRSAIATIRRVLDPLSVGT